VSDDATFEEPSPSDEELLAEAFAEVIDPLLEAEQMRDEYLSALQRLQADFENYKKRVARISEDVAARSAADVIVKLLPVIDALDLAQAHFASAEAAELDTLESKALVQARSLLIDTLSKEGLERIDEVGASFDPQVHDAVAHVPGDGEQVIDDVLRAGYQFKGVVIRPAMVRVRG
jgi:molecular chaperone GrpE